MPVSKETPKDNYRLRREMPGFIPESQEHLWPVQRDDDRMPGYIPDEPKKGKKSE